MRYIISAIMIGALTVSLMGCGKAELQKKDADIKALTEQVTALQAEKDKCLADLKAATDEATALKAAAAPAKPEAPVAKKEKRKAK